MSIHLGATKGQIADTVLLPGDPLRAKLIAEKYLDRAVCHNQVRGMLGYTGYYKGRKVSVQGTGMGIPSIGIYAHELIAEYRVKTLVRIGTCGAIQPGLKLGDVILAVSASTDSNVNRVRFGGLDFAATADFGLLRAAHDAAKQQGIRVAAGNVLSSDSFYGEDPQAWKLWQRFGTLAIEMETAELYTLAARHRRRALSILTVSDEIIAGRQATAAQRQGAFMRMVEIALAAAR
ncbi:purine-nucleoside phosphorylase [bacterium]|nr:purine-nucleoside phosphorylase [bacterium]